MNEVLIPQATPILLQHYQQDQVDIDSFKEVNNWFIVVTDDTGDSSVYTTAELSTLLHENILEGKHSKDSAVTIHVKSEDGSWSEAGSSLMETAKSYFKLRVLYQPIWSYVMEGLKWGIIVGVALKLFDTFIMLAFVNSGIAFLFVIAVGTCFIPRIGWLGMALIGFMMARFGGVNVFMMALGSGLTGAILGCLPGMGIGGVVGYFRKNSLPLAKDAPPESNSLFIMAVLLPLIAGITLIVFYIIVVNPWMVGLME